jgi:hypothetical protein
LEDVEVKEVNAGIDGKLVEFEAKSFSIYAIVETEDPIYRLSVNFHI